VLVGVVLTVTAGEMLFGPASEALAAEAAAPGQVGAYLGAATAGNWIGAAAAPAIGLPLADALGEAALWGALVAVAAGAAACYWRASAGSRDLLAPAGLQVGRDRLLRARVEVQRRADG